MTYIVDSPFKLGESAMFLRGIIKDSLILVALARRAISEEAVERIYMGGGRGDFGMIGEGGVGEMGVRGIVWSVHLIDELFARHKKGLKEEGSITLKMRRCFLFSN